MCGIFGFVGDHHDVCATLLPALRSLEYRGYDSWGLVWDQTDGLGILKQTGRVPKLVPLDARSQLAMGHTRWATHGGVTKANAHPHIDCTGRIAIVHNGVIENAETLRAALGPLHRMSSETDSEIVVHMLEDRIAAGHSVLHALMDIFPRLEGQNAIIALDHREKQIAAVMNVSPLLVGTGPRGTYIASDPFALWGSATSMTVIPGNAYVQIDGSTVQTFDLEGRPISGISSQPVPIPENDPLGNYDHYMAKEMAEQSPLLRTQAVNTGIRHTVATMLRESGTIVLTGCGSALIAARLGATWFGERAGLQAVTVEASEFRTILPFVNQQCTVVALSQSGETADVLSALQLARRRGARTVGLINVQHSTAARTVDQVLPLGCGRERSVLATKSFTAMLGELLALATILAGEPDVAADALIKAADAITRLDADPGYQASVRRVATLLAVHRSVLAIGRGTGLPIALELALKCKEASYIQAEAFAAGELKHGAIALVEDGLPCLVILDSANTRKDLQTSATELSSRGACTIGVGHDVGPTFDEGIELPDVGVGMPLLLSHVAHQIGYHLAVTKGLDPDYPRNLAKSVTVK